MAIRTHAFESGDLPLRQCLNRLVQTMSQLLVPVIKLQSPQPLVERMSLVKIVLRRASSPYPTPCPGKPGMSVAQFLSV